MQKKGVEKKKKERFLCLQYLNGNYFLFWRRLIQRSEIRRNAFSNYHGSMAASRGGSWKLGWINFEYKPSANRGRREGSRGKNSWFSERMIFRCNETVNAIIGKIHLKKKCGKVNVVTRFNNMNIKLIKSRFAFF